LFEIKKKDLLYGYIAYFFKYAGNILVLPFIVRNFSSSEFAIWIIFLAISTLLVLFDLGYGVVIQRYAMYATSGAKQIDLHTLPIITISNEPNYKLLYQIMIASNKIYSRLSKFISLALIIFSPYIVYISRSEYSSIEIILAWIVFSISVVINMYILSDATIIKGLGLIGQLQKIILVNSIFSTAVKMISLELGLGISGLSISFLVTSILLAFQYKRITSSEKNRDFKLYSSLKKTFDIDFFESFIIIKKKSNGIGGVLISNFVQNQLFTIVAPLFISLEVMGRFGLTSQVIGIVASLSSITFTTYTTRMGNYIVSNKMNNLKETFSITISIFLVLFFTGSLVTLSFGKNLLRLIGSNTELLPTNQLILVVLFVLIIQINQKSTNIISLSNNQNYVKSLMVSSGLIAIINIILLLFGFGISEVLISGILIHSSYNLWKWTLESMKLCGVKFADFYIIPYLKIKKALHNQVDHN
jgi:hypothetical protein